jgi:hypothetical protein
MAASAVATGVILLAFATDVSGPEAAIVQRAAVTVPQAAVAAIAARLLWRGPGHAGSDGQQASAGALVPDHGDLRDLRHGMSGTKPGTLLRHGHKGQYASKSPSI